MQPTTQQHIIFGEPERQDLSGSLWGASARSIAGSLQLLFGVLEVIFGIVVIVLPLDLADYTDVWGWGICCGVFAIISGSFGIGSRRSKCMVVAYLVLSIVAAVICAFCIFLGVGSAIYVTQIVYGYYGSFDTTYARTHFIIYVVLTVVLVLQMLASIIGASFTCGALCYSQGANAQQTVYFYPPQTSAQMNRIAPPSYTVVTTGQPSFQCFSNTTLEPSTHDMPKFPS